MSWLALGVVRVDDTGTGVRFCTAVAIDEYAMHCRGWGRREAKVQP
jgi:hypothetical protein